MEIKIEFVIDGKERSFLLCPLHSQFVGVANRKLEELLTLLFVEMQWEADPLWYWLQSKGFPAALIYCHRCPLYNQLLTSFFHAFCFQQRDLEKCVHVVPAPGCLLDLVEGLWISLKEIKYPVMDETVLDMEFDAPKTKIVDTMNMPKESVSKIVVFDQFLSWSVNRYCSFPKLT
ncbi:hypothetical protein HU200_050400 [Digitaria exilis]|uniref:Uncharacterized protein n=1 Tax=Digitaria exilis TaxID=1010633 RepID=A0A835E7L7_9POAL|nr:hypothetical protein HU200_050400 [Digitaria exilis]